MVVIDLLRSAGADKPEVLDGIDSALDLPSGRAAQGDD